MVGCAFVVVAWGLCAPLSKRIKRQFSFGRLPSSLNDGDGMRDGVVWDGTSQPGRQPGIPRVKLFRVAIPTYHGLWCSEYIFRHGLDPTTWIGHARGYETLLIHSVTPLLRSVPMKLLLPRKGRTRPRTRTLAKKETTKNNNKFPLLIIG